jgi:hypothetical protein
MSKLGRQIATLLSHEHIFQLMWDYIANPHTDPAVLLIRHRVHPHVIEPAQFSRRSSCLGRRLLRICGPSPGEKRFHQLRSIRQRQYMRTFLLNPVLSRRLPQMLQSSRHRPFCGGHQRDQDSSQNQKASPQPTPRFRRRRDISRQQWRFFLLHPSILTRHLHGTFDAPLDSGARVYQRLMRDSNLAHTVSST